MGTKEKEQMKVSGLDKSIINLYNKSKEKFLKGDDNKKDLEQWLRWLRQMQSPRIQFQEIL
jgi:hypothetical protein